MNNLDFFNASTKYKEKLIDPNYHIIVDRNVIPKSSKDFNNLTLSNNKVIKYITSIDTLLNDLNKNIDDIEVENLLKLIIQELNTKGMNYSAFCQYFNVHNINYSIFSKLSQEEKIDILKFIIKPYINTRHTTYLSHGYSNIVLQVMSDNYSHKRKGTYGTNKIVDILKLHHIPDLAKEKKPNFNKPSFFLLSDKNGKNLFKWFAKLHGISLSENNRVTEKFPDALIKINNEYFIVEQKNMKENGGGQDKQASEITSFIYKKPEFENLHYVTYIDGMYFNQIDSSAHAKTLQHYNDIINALSLNTNNYFVNSYGFEELIKITINNEFI